MGGPNLSRPGRASHWFSVWEGSVEGSRIPSAGAAGTFEAVYAYGNTSVRPIHRWGRMRIGSCHLLLPGSSRALPPISPTLRAGSLLPDGLLPPPQPAGSDIGRPFARVLGDVTRGAEEEGGAQMDLLPDRQALACIRTEYASLAVWAAGLTCLRTVRGDTGNGKFPPK